MPELPEVECIVRGLQNSVAGEKISGVEFVFERMLLGLAAPKFAGQVCGRTIRRVNRRGKYILFTLSGGKILEVHLRMTGRFIFYPGPAEQGKYTGAVFYLAGGGQLHFQDMRKFGTFRLWEAAELAEAVPFCSGPDPLEDDFALEAFLQMMGRKPNSKIKVFLLDQRNIMGMGNIYTDEALFRAGLHPERKTGELGAADKKRLFGIICGILQEAITFRGTSFSDYRDLTGSPGNFQNRLRVYQRAGKACLQCGEAIRRIVVAGRGTYFCPHCQV